MPSQPVLDGLAKLQSKLAELEPAIEHTRIAREATALVQTIGESHHKLITETGQKIDQHLVSTQAGHRQVQKKLEAVPALLQEALLTSQGTVQEKLNDAAKDLEISFAGILAEHGKTLTDISQLHTDKVSQLSKSIDQTIHDLSAVSKTFLTQIADIQKVVENLRTLTSQLSDLNLPTRLDKLDATVAAINLGMQNQQAAAARLEERLTDSFGKWSADFTQFKEKLSQELAVSSRQSKSRQVAAIVISVIGFLGLILIILWQARG